MATLNIDPGTLDITLASINDMSILLDFDIDLSGYTFDAKVETTTITVTNTDLSSGQITLSLTDSQVAALGKGRHRWRLKWNDGSIDFVALAGTFDVSVY